MLKFSDIERHDVSPLLKKLLVLDRALPVDNKLWSGNLDGNDRVLTQCGCKNMVAVRAFDQVLCWVCTVEYAASDKGGMMSRHWFPHMPPVTLLICFFAVSAQYGGIAGLGDCSILCLAESSLKVLSMLHSFYENRINLDPFFIAD